MQDRPDFHQKDQFEHRHIGPSPSELKDMLATVGVSSLDELIDETIPENIRFKSDLNLPNALSEPDCLALLENMANQNKVFKSYIGMGYYNTHTPSPILRNIFQDPSWYTAYTPYQAEISQGRLEALLNYQTVVSELTGMEIANASLLDEATAAAEAMVMLYAAQDAKDKRNKFLVSHSCFPQTLAVIRTRAEGLGIEVTVSDTTTSAISDDYFGVIVQYPDQFGNIYDYQNLVSKAHDDNVKVVVATDLLALTLLTPPGEWGADVAVGSSQRFGVPMGYGGPHAAFFATRDEFKRFLPGRIIGLSHDRLENPALRMALQTREQHIRKEKALSNICTAQALLAIIAGMYAVYHGPENLIQTASTVQRLASVLAESLRKAGLRINNDYQFDTVTIDTSAQAEGFVESVKHHSISAEMNLRYENSFIGISLDETTTAEDVSTLLSVFGKALNADIPAVAPAANTIPENCVRKSAFMQQPLFQQYRNETDLMRYIKRLVRKDYGLNDGMIPLGSCTMKLNAATQMMPVSYAGFANMHPFTPASQAQGYQQLIGELEDLLKEITQYDAISLQPNAGSQGEYAGLRVIDAYHKHQGNHNRDVVLVPTSAHGTNFATVSLCGKRVVLVKCDEEGNIDLNDLKEKCAKHEQTLCAFMVTYPSTHGVFESKIQDVCEIVHQYGGQVYMDGANMNAQSGFTSPGSIGADVCHLNLHKTFAIPHGGGGPGMGPIGVKAHLAPFLPGHAHAIVQAEHAMGPVTAAPWSSASILPISYAYIRLLGREGVRNATAYAILNANYIKSRLEGHYNILYSGEKGRVAHELIVDLRNLRKDAGIEAEDLAKRLMDYGFHAPTLSWPVAHSVMVEPTESESKSELDRFCDAMISIRQEIQDIADGKSDKKANPLKNAPHTLNECVGTDWPHPYSRETACTPSPYTKQTKFWPSVARINQAYGDRNLVCTCPTAADFEEAHA